MANDGQVLPGTPAKVTRTVTIAPNALAQMVMYFDTGDQVSKDLAADTTR